VSSTFIDCGSGSNVILSNNNGFNVVLFMDVVDPPASGIRMDDGSVFVFQCTGRVYEDFSGGPSIGQVILPLPQFPYETALMGLAGIVCASFIAWAFLRG